MNKEQNSQTGSQSAELTGYVPPKKDCAFQYATGDANIFEDTDLITREEADKLWDEYMPKFMEHLEAGRNPEMCIWVNMKHDVAYHTDEKHLYGDDCIIRDGRLYVLYT